MLRPIRTASFALSVLILVSASGSGQTKLTAKANGFQPRTVAVVAENDRSRDGLVGPVRRVRTEIVKLTNENGKLVEGRRALLEVVSYDVKGNKIENQYFPVAGATLTGKEVYKYDDKGNISEMTLLNDDGSLVGRETYKYEFDFAGNWNKMTTSVAVIDSGKVSFEPTEVTYRSIMYYLDENMAKMLQPAATPNNDAKNPADGPARNSSSTQKVSVALPSVKSDKLDVADAVAVKSVSPSSDTKSQEIVVDTEPPPPAPRPILKPVSGGVLNGVAISLPAPSYPDTAKRMRVFGVVVVDVVLDETGKVISAQASSGPTILRDAAVQAALKARFSPTKLSGQPVKIAGVINYKFSMTQ